MKSVLQFLFVSNNSKDILSKKPTKEDHLKSLNCFIGRYFYIFALAAIVLLLILFVVVCFAIVGSATESGNLYNHLGEVI